MDLLPFEIICEIGKFLYSEMRASAKIPSEFSRREFCEQNSLALVPQICDPQIVRFEMPGLPNLNDFI